MDPGRVRSPGGESGPGEKSPGRGRLKKADDMGIERLTGSLSRQPELLVKLGRQPERQVTVFGLD